MKVERYNAIRRAVREGRGRGKREKKERDGERGREEKKREGEKEREGKEKKGGELIVIMNHLVSLFFLFLTNSVWRSGLLVSLFLLRL